MVDSCTNCGTQLDEESLFCEACGTRVSAMSLPTETAKTLESQQPITKPSSVPPPPAPRQTVFVSEPRKKSFLWIAIGIIIILIAGAGMAGFLWWAVWGEEYLGENSFVIESKTILDVQLDITNSAGDVSIDFVSSNNLFDAKVKVYGNRDADINDATNFTSSVVNGQYQAIEFDSSIDQGDFSYKLVISIAREARTKVAIETSSGDQTIDVSASTSLTGLDLKSSSGDIDIDLGIGAMVNFSSSELQVSSGDINLAWADLVVERDISWAIDSSSGSVDIDISQYQQPATQKTIDFVISVSSGDIYIGYDLGSDIGLSLTGSASSGDINFPGGRDSYQSSNYASAVLRLNFDIAVSSGDADAGPRA